MEPAIILYGNVFADVVKDLRLGSSSEYCRGGGGGAAKNYHKCPNKAERRLKRKGMYMYICVYIVLTDVHCMT